MHVLMTSKHALAHLTKYTAEIAATEEDASGAVVPLDEGLFAEMGCYRPNLDSLGTYKAHTSLLVAVYPAKSRTQVAVAQVRIRL